MPSGKRKIPLNKIAVFVGKFAPFHLGHEWIVRKMIENFSIKNCLLIIGSINNPFSLRHCFSYYERRRFIKRIFPEIKIVGLADFFHLGNWLLALDDLLQAAFPGRSKEDFIFFSGGEKDIDFFIDSGYKIRVYNRFRTISATKIRERLLRSESLDGLINKMNIKEMREVFQGKFFEN